jgi:hypothetical protein
VHADISGGDAPMRDSARFHFGFTVPYRQHRDAASVIARLPFIERPDHPAGTPVLVISRPLEGSGARDVVLYSARLERWSNPAARGLAELGGELIGTAGEAQGLSVLVAAPGELGRETLAAAFAPAGLASGSVIEVGSHAARFRVSQEPR